MLDDCNAHNNTYHSLEMILWIAINHKKFLIKIYITQINYNFSFLHEVMTLYKYILQEEETVLVVMRHTNW